MKLKEVIGLFKLENQHTGDLQDFLKESLYRG